MPYATITATRHLPERRSDALRPVRGYWQVVTASAGVVGSYVKSDLGQAIQDAAMLRKWNGMACDVRKAVR